MEYMFFYFCLAYMIALSLFILTHPEYFSKMWQTAVSHENELIKLIASVHHLVLSVMALVACVTISIISSEMIGPQPFLSIIGAIMIPAFSFWIYVLSTAKDSNTRSVIVASIWFASSMFLTSAVLHGALSREPSTITATVTEMVKNVTNRGFTWPATLSNIMAELLQIVRS